MFIINILVVAAVINFLILVFYSYFKTVWPEEYFDKDDRLSLAISISFKRLFLFRIIPVFSITFLVFSYVNFDFNIQEWIVFGVFVTFIYAILTSGYSLLKIIRNSKNVRIYTNKPTQILYHFVSILLLILIGGFVGFITNFKVINSLNSNVRSLYDNVIAAMLYSAVIFPLMKIYRYWTGSSNPSINEIISKSLKEIKEDKNIYQQLISSCKRNNANLNLVLAFCIVENIQRPKWFREIENKLLFINSTKGIMQIKSKWSISDSKSIEIAIPKYFKNTSSELLDEDKLYLLVEKYNGMRDNKYYKFVEQAIYNIDEIWYRKIMKLEY